MMIKMCRQCNKVFRPRYGTKQLFCSRGCYLAYHSVPNLICKNCGQGFKTWHPKQVFCSRECYLEWWRDRSGIILTCSYCGLQFIRKLSHYRRSRKNKRYKTKQVFCSRQCYGRYFGQTHGKGIIFRGILQQYSVRYKVTLHGLLIPALWPEYYRKPQIHKIHRGVEAAISQQELEAVFANNTGITIIDDLTRNLPLSYRSDVRQETTLRCLELNINITNEDAIAEIIRQIVKKYRNDEYRRYYGERSLFSKPFKDSNTELWQTIADPTADFITEIENRELLKEVMELKI